VAAFLYGVSPIDNKQVKEIKVCYPLWTFPADADRLPFQRRLLGCRNEVAIIVLSFRLNFRKTISF
jgi:hypothetical protein